MASKRASQERGQGSEEEDRDFQFQVPGKRRQGGNPQPKICRLSLLHTITANDIALHAEPVFRKVVQEMIPRMLQRCLTNSHGLRPNQLANTSGGRRRLQLCFINKLPKTIFTRSDIKAEGGEPLQFELRDAAHQQRIVGDVGGYSPMKIRVCVLNGEFGSNGEEDWTTDEFNSQIAIPQKGKGTLLNRDPVIITLKNGVGYIKDDVVFTDISRTPNKEFRLGLKVIEQPNSIGADIREGRSEPFRVKDQRGKAYIKYKRLSLNDEVWRLKGIRRGSDLQTSHGIETVKDLLQLYITNQTSLKEKLGKTAGKTWNTIIELAKDCDVDDERYIYCATEQSISLVFNCIYQVLEVTFDGLIYCSIESLNPEEKRLVEKIKQQAYNNLKDLKPLDPTTHGLGMISTGVQTAQIGGPDQCMQPFDLPIAQQGQPETWPSSSTLREMLPHDFAEGQLYSEAYPYVGISQIDPFAIDLFSMHGNVNPFPLGYGDGAECSNNSCWPNSGVCISKNGKCKTVWHKIFRTAFKCFILHVG